MPLEFEPALYELGMYMAVGLLLLVGSAIFLGVITLPGFFLVLFGCQLAVRAAQVTGIRLLNYLGLMFRNITRNLLRTSLTYVAIFVLVFVISAVWTMLNFIDSITKEQKDNLKAIITEKHQIPSKMPRSYEQKVIDVALKLPKNMQPKNGEDDIMTWAFVFGSLDPKKQSTKNTLFLLALEPGKILTMMDGLDSLSKSEMEELTQGVAVMKTNPRAVVIGAEKLELMEKRVGDRIKVTCINYPGMEFDFAIIGAFPKGSRYAQSALMSRDYLYRAIDELERRTGKNEHSDKCLNLIWVRLPTVEAFETMAAEINKPGGFMPAIKMETQSAAFSTFLDPYKDIFWGMRWIVSPMMMIIITLIIAIAVSIGVRERRTEMAVLKVLGFKPWQVLSLVLGEALLVGVISGTISTTLIYLIVTLSGGKIPLLPPFMLTSEMLWWGPVIGAGASFVGSVVPAWTAHKIKVAEVFARVA